MEETTAPDNGNLIASKEREHEEKQQQQRLSSFE
jgi:hypothetical protein